MMLTRRDDNRLFRSPFSRMSLGLLTGDLPGVLVWLPLIILLVVAGPAQAEHHEVGPGKRYSEIEQVPWESLQPGDQVSIHTRPDPYRAKWVICRRGTAERPIVVRGIADDQGRLPVIDGRDAVTRSELNFWSEGRGVIKIGGANRPADTTPAHIIIENLEIRSGRMPYQFTGRSGEASYLKNAAGIFIEKGEQITIRGCTLQDCGNGLFAASASRDILVEHCSIHNNGVEGSIYEHNNYTSAAGMTFQFNHFGPLREGCPGNNLKDRSAGLVVRYNWIQGGNRALDLVDGGFQEQEAYRRTHVYGNVLVELDDKGNNQVVHYGGDSGQTDRYRKGVLVFVHNTVVSYRSGNTTLFRLSTPDERVLCHNNIFFATAPGDRLSLLGESGSAELFNNWFKSGWQTSRSGDAATVQQRGETLVGEAPGFIDLQRQDYRLDPSSPCVGAGANLPEPLRSQHPLLHQYEPHRQQTTRPEKSPPDLGALPAADAS